MRLSRHLGFDKYWCRLNILKGQKVVSGWVVWLQVELAQCEYQLPRLTRMWTHLERQAGGRVRGMGEKQLEIDKRLLRSRMAGLRRNLDDTRR